MKQQQQQHSSNSPQQQQQQQQQQPYQWSQVVQNNITQSAADMGGQTNNNGNYPRRQQQQQQQNQKMKQQQQGPQQQQRQSQNPMGVQQQQQQHQQQRMHPNQENNTNGHRMSHQNTIPNQQPIIWSPQPFPSTHHPQMHSDPSIPASDSQNQQQGNHPRQQQQQQQQQQGQHVPQQQQQQQQEQCDYEPPPLNTDKYSYEWDPQNAQRFLSARAAMLSAIFSAANNNNNSNRANAVDNSSVNQGGGSIPLADYQRSHSDMVFTSPTRPHDGKHFARAASVDAVSRQQPLPPPSLPHAKQQKPQPSNRQRPSSDQKQQQQQQQQPGMSGPNKRPGMTSPDSSNDIASSAADGDATVSTVMATLDEVLPIPQTYFSYAIRYLLMDTPLPLVVVGGQGAATAADSTCVKIRPRPLHPDETIFLLPRFWMGKWVHWARNTIVIVSIESWFAHWERFDSQWSKRNDDPSSQGRAQGKTQQQQQSRQKRTFSFLPELLKALSALSILSDQYQLHGNTEKDWIEWFRGLENCWIRWNEQIQQQHQQQQQSQKRSSMDEKKHEEELHQNHQNSNSPRPNQNSPHSPAAVQPAPYPQLAFPNFPPPGPIDSRILSTRHRPLLMHPHISLSMKGLDNSSNDNESNESLLTPAEEMDEALLCQFVDSLSADDPRKLAVCPVPAQFYEMLRSTQGVHCDDGDLSFDAGIGGASGGAAGGGGGGGRGGSGGNAPTSSLLSHDQWEVDNDGNDVPPSRNDNKVDYRGYHPYYYDNDLGAARESTNGGNHASSSFDHTPVRPIEFRRRILFVPFIKNEGMENGLNGGAQQKVTSPYSKLMQEAMKSQNESREGEQGGQSNNNSIGSRPALKKSGAKGNNARGLTVDTSAGINNGGADAVAEDNDRGCIVELFPVEFHYVVVDGAMTPTDNDNTNDNTNGKNGSSNNNNDNASDNPTKYSRKGIALASRVSPVARVLRDLERAAAPDRASACTRLWRRGPAFDDGAGAAGGDGYDLLDASALAPAPSGEGAGSPTPTPCPGAAAAPAPPRPKRDAAPLTVEKWLGAREPSIAQDGDHRSRASGAVVVELLIEMRTSPTSDWVREPLELGNRLQVGDFVDAQDSARKWYEAVVREVTPESVKVHYFGWGSRWDTNLPRTKGTNSKQSPPVPLWTKTARWREQIKVGDEVEIRESTSMVQRPKWHRATVLAVGNETDSPRELEGGAELELLEENKLGKKVPLMLLNRKRQILVEVPQEIHNCSTTPLTPPRNNNTNNGDIIIPAAHPPFRRWVNLYSEEICKVNTHKTAKKQTNSPATLNYTMESKRPPVEVMKPFNNIHGSGFVRESLRGIPPAAGTVGLHNLGNSCYMNSILQCINHIKPITQYFLKGDYLKEMNKNNPLGSGGRVATAYASFLNDIWAGEFSILAPRLLKQTVSHFAPQFNNNYQHDSQEFCQYLMDGLHEDLNRVREKPYVEQFEAFGMEDSRAAMESWRKHLLRHDSIFVDYTQGMHRSHLTCPSCGRESIKFDVYSSISLPLVPAKDRFHSIPLKDCLDQFAAGEQLDEHNAWYCSSCKKHVCALKLITLWNTPDVLVLHLKRFTFEKCPMVDGRLLRRKIEEKVDFPIDRLDLSSYIIGPTDPEAPPIYKLFGVSEHTGSTANSGHYTATVRNAEDGNWYRYNDSHVGTTSGDAAVTGGAYLLFYQRVKGSLRWAGMEKRMMAERSQNDSNTMAAAGEDTDGFREVTGKKKKKRP